MTSLGRRAHAGAWGLLAALLGVGPVAAAPEDPAGIEMEVLRLEGPARKGRWVGVSAAGVRWTPADAATETLELDAVDELRFAVRAGSPLGATALRLRVTLVGGERLVASRWGPAPDGLRLESPSFGALELAFDVLRSLEPLPPSAGPCHDPAGRSAPPRGADLALLVGGDEVSGTLLEATPEGLVFEGGGGRKRSLAWESLSVVHLDNPTLPPPAGRVAEVETLGDDVLASTQALASGADGALAVPLASDASRVARVPPAALRALRWRGTRSVNLTSLPFTSTYEPLLQPVPGSLAADYLQREFGARVGRRPRGCPLRLDGRTYVHGLAVHSGSTVRVALGGAFRRFQAWVGIDDEAKEEGRGSVDVPGDVDVRVLGDGKTLWEAKGVTGLDAARRVGPLDVGGVQELVLVVDHGGHDQMLDRVTWADPLLTR